MWICFYVLIFDLDLTACGDPPLPFEALKMSVHCSQFHDLHFQISFLCHLNEFDSCMV